MSSFQEYFNGVRHRIDERLQDLCSALPDGPLRTPLIHALEGGKRVRGFLVIESARLHDLNDNSSEHAAVSIECLHSYSLVHDDLPCMDDDPVRRGQPTVHVKWDEMTAVLVGDALQALAFQILADSRRISDPNIRSALLYNLARCAGLNGMVQGQMLDMTTVNSAKGVASDDIITIQKLKTGAIIGWACQAGAILAGADPKPLGEYAKNLGLAYQIADDLLDVCGQRELVGKNVRKDAEVGKPTFVSLLGKQEARRQATAFVEQAIASLESYGNRADNLKELARYAINRSR